MLSSMESAPPARSPRSRKPSPPSSPSLVLAMVPPVSLAEVRWPTWLEPMGAPWSRPAPRKPPSESRSR